MRYVYPCILTADDEEGEGFVVTFPDVPEAITGVKNWEESLKMAQDGLAVALGMYVKSREKIPEPSAVAPGQVLISVPPVVASKLALYSAMRSQGITNVALAARLELSEGRGPQASLTQTIALISARSRKPSNPLGAR